MPTQYRWHKTISNGYSTKVIRGMTKAEVEQKAAAQQAIWQQQAAQRFAKAQAQIARQNAQDQVRRMEAQAQSEANDAQARARSLTNLLQNGLHTGKHFVWEEAKVRREYPPFAFTEHPPTYEAIANRVGVL